MSASGQKRKSRLIIAKSALPRNRTSTDEFYEHTPSYVGASVAPRRPSSPFCLPGVMPRAPGTDAPAIAEAAIRENLLALSYLRNDVSRLGKEAMRLCAFL
jgi:hypothetical protein